MEQAALRPFSEPVRRWFAQSFDAPTPPQLLGWPSIAAGRHTLICAPTGSGKTLAAFLWCLDEVSRRLQSAEEVEAGVHTLYISPLKALNYDVERNLREPLLGIRAAAQALGQPAPQVEVGVRTGDTTSAGRARMLRKPPHLLITTPESLYILLTSKRALPMLSTVRYIIVDEVHALCGNKRGVSLALSLERLVERCTGPEPVRIGLSATIRPLDGAARFLGGARWVDAQHSRLEPRPVEIVDAGGRKDLDLQVVAPVPDLGHLPGDSVWPEVHAQLLDWIRRHHSTLIFVGMRAQSERISRALNELAGADLASAHHGSLSRSVRLQLEERLKRGQLPALISTGTLELGIDVGAIDLVVQAGSPGAVSSGLQRVGRAGHLLTERSRGRLISLYREDLVECTVIARRMLEGKLERVRAPQNALDVLAQHIVSAAAIDERTGEELLALFRQAAPYHELQRRPFEAVLGLLAGRYPADVARGLAAKLVWERSTDTIRGLPGAARLATTTGGTIPDRGYYGLKLPDGTKLGELEEEFVFERTVGDVIAFGSSAWRIRSIDRQHVVVTPAPGRPAVVPFWKGGLFGRDPELSEAVGAFRRELFARVEDPAAAAAWLRRRYPVDEWAAAGLVAYFGEQRRRELELGTDRTIVVEQFSDELGDHLLLVHACLGNRLNAPLAMALRRQLRQRLGIDPQVISDDNGILFRVPAGEAQPPMDLLSLVRPDALQELVSAELSGTAMYGTLFRQNAARFLVLGSLGHGRRTPLWLQRLRAKDLQDATAGSPEFPVRLETFRECLQEMMDLPRLASVLERLRSGELRLVTQQTDRPSPVASGLLNRFIGQYMYEYDEPRAERVLTRLQLDRSLLDGLLSREEGLTDLLLPEATSELQERWQGRADRTRARNADELLATVQRLVVLQDASAAQHCEDEPGAEAMIETLLADGRLSRFCVEDEDAAWLCATEDLPLLAAAHAPRTVATEPTRELEARNEAPADARERLLLRLLEPQGPATVDELKQRTGLSPGALEPALDALVEHGKLRRGRFRAEVDAPEVCTPFNLQQIRRRSIAHARRQVEPVDPEVLQRFVLNQQLLGPARQRGPEGLQRAVERLALRPVPAALLERDLLGARVEDYQPDWLDDLVARGELLWTGGGEQRLLLLPRDDLAMLPPGVILEQAEARQVQALLGNRGASFISDLAADLGASGMTVAELRRALWALVWAGHATNDRVDSLRRGITTSFEPPSANAGALDGPRINPLTGRPSTIGSRRRGPTRAAVRRSLKPGADPWAGRWSLLPTPGPDATASVEDLVWLVVRRYGLVARELVQLEEGITWSELYPTLCQLELCGELRRGLFVQGLGAAQFAPADAVDALRDLRAAPAGEPLLISACDPAFVAPAVGVPLPGPSLPRRPGNHAVLQGGRVVLTIEGGGKRLWLDGENDDEARRGWLALLPALLKRGQRAVRVKQIDGEPAPGSALRPALEALGFKLDSEALELRRFV